MPMVVLCPSCDSRLKVAVQPANGHVKCPKCSSDVRVRVPETAPAAPEQRVREGLPKAAAARSKTVGAAEDRVSASPVKASKAPPPPKEEEIPEFDLEEVGDESESHPAKPKKKRQDENADDEVVKVKKKKREEDSADDEAPRAKKKKKKKKAKQALYGDEDRPTWPVWVIGGGSVMAVMILLFCLGFMSRPGHPLKWPAIYLFISTPINTVVFFAAMFLCSIWFGAIEIGEIHVALFKAFFLLLLVNMVSLVPMGYILTLTVWLAGLFTLFRLDLWEARVLIGMNWILNMGLKWLLVMFFLQYAASGGRFNVDDDDDPPPARVNMPGQVVDDDP